MTEFSTETDPLQALRLQPGAQRPRRLRRTPALRDLVRETTLAPDDFVYPFFVVPGDGVRNPVASMPGIDQVSVDELTLQRNGGCGHHDRVVVGQGRDEVRNRLARPGARLH